MVYHVHMHNSGYYGRRSFNTRRAAWDAAVSWVLNCNGRTASIQRKGQSEDFARFWTDRYGLQYLEY